MKRRQMLWMCGGSLLAAANGKREDMLVHNISQEGFEMSTAGFTDWITPLDRFFVRSHHSTPKVDLATWKLTVGGLATSPLTLTMPDVRAMKSLEHVAMLECAGNGRGLYEPSMPGLQWEYGGAGNGRWRGVRLADVLKRAGVPPTVKHVLFDGADVPVGTQPEFQRTIPIAKAMDGDTMLAFQMNGQDLPVSHGFPLRLVVPGWAGDSWVKWVTGIQLLDREFDGFFMKTGYRHPGRAVSPGQAVKPEDMKPVEELQIKSVIATVDGGIAGAAWSGEKAVARVEVSTDEGRTWKPARITSPRTAYGMVTWSFPWTAPPGFYSVMARAYDTAGRTQPLQQEWNPSGYQWNPVHRVARPATASTPAAGGPPQPAGFKQACLSCHDEGPMRLQRLTRGQWDAEMSKMQRWGAPVAGNQRSQILDYLSSRYPYLHRR